MRSTAFCRAQNVISKSGVSIDRVKVILYRLPCLLSGTRQAPASQPVQPMCPLNCPYPRAQGTVSVLGPRQLSPGRAAQPPGGLHRQAPPVLRDRVLVSFPNPKSDHLLLLLKARQCSHCPRMTVTPPPGMPCPHSQPHPLRPCPHPPDTPACHVLSPRHSRALLPECLLPPAVSFLDLDTSHVLVSPGTQSVLHLLGKAFPSRKSNSCRHCSSPSRTAGSEHLRMHLCADVSVSPLAGR